MYAGKSRTNKAITATHWNGSAWSNGKPDSSKDAFIDASYTTENGNFSCRDLVITSTAILTIITDSYVKVLRNLNQSPTSQIVVKSDGDLMFLHKDAETETARVQVEATFKNHQRLDYEFISSPISGIPIKNISPGTLDNRFYTYDEGTNSYSIINPNASMTVAGGGYMIRIPTNFPTTISDWTITVNNYFNGSMGKGIILKSITKNLYGINIIGNPYTSKINLRKFHNTNKEIILSSLFFWNKSNGAQGISYSTSNLTTDNLNKDNKDIKSFKGCLITKKNNTPPNEVVFTTDMMIPSKDFSIPDRIYINIKQDGVNFPIGGFCYDVRKFPSPFEDVINTGSITVNDNGYKIICRKESFNLTDIINIRIFFEIAATYTISIKDTLGLFEELQHVYLVDQLSGITHDLKSIGYIFTSAAGEFLDRFKIKFQL